MTASGTGPAVTLLVALALVFVTALVTAACGGSENDDGAGTGDGGQTTVRVFAAASLTDAFAALAAGFEEANPGLDVQLNLAGSTALATQILDGAPADVMASANQSTMDDLVAAGAIDGAPSVFATNRLTIAVPSGNPGMIGGLADFANPELFIGLCLPEVPCGRLAATLLDRAGVDPAVDSFEPDVRALLTKLEAGELDAGLVYVTDLVESEAAVGIDLPDGDNNNNNDVDVARYPIGIVAETTNRETAKRFVAYVLSQEGRATLRSFGFGLP